MKFGILFSQKNKKWIVKALDRGTRKTIAWVIGGRDVATFKRLYEKVKHLTSCVFYTDSWEAFAKALPAVWHIIEKAHTTAIEQDNSNTRHHLGRMTRRTKVVSQKVEMVVASLKIWCALSIPKIFAHYQEVFLSIFN